MRHCQNCQSRHQDVHDRVGHGKKWHNSVSFSAVSVAAVVGLLKHLQRLVDGEARRLLSWRIWLLPTGYRHALHTAKPEMIGARADFAFAARAYDVTRAILIGAKE